MNATLATRKTNMETTLGKIAGCQVELTIRGEKSFTVSAEGCATEGFAKLARFFGFDAVVTVEYDADIDYTVAYIEIK